jgi:hypothetical protein
MIQLILKEQIFKTSITLSITSIEPTALYVTYKSQEHQEKKLVVSLNNLSVDLSVFHNKFAVTLVVHKL